MKVFEVYKKFTIPPNLQEHMLRVASIVDYLQKHWVGEHIDWESTKKMALVHDLGNIVRFDFEKYPEFLGDEEINIDYWKRVQKEAQKKYGMDDHDATQKMLEELGFNKDTIEVVLSKSFINSILTKDSSSWPLKLVFYADFRTLPLGIGSVEERITEVKERRPDFELRPDFKALVEACFDIEKQIQKNLDLSVAKINNDSVNVDKNLLTMEIS